MRGETLKGCRRPSAKCVRLTELCSVFSDVYRSFWMRKPLLIKPLQLLRRYRLFPPSQDWACHALSGWKQFRPEWFQMDPQEFKCDPAASQVRGCLNKNRTCVDQKLDHHVCVFFFFLKPSLPLESHQINNPVSTTWRDSDGETGWTDMIVLWKKDGVMIFYSHPHK